ncbi:hypothetical protein OPQ81_004050 [Rhizoctonia solani]|nr:hypothetical protein OPQ81_004050 [Rhizoctonia solani]
MTIQFGLPLGTLDTLSINGVLEPLFSSRRTRVSGVVYVYILYDPTIGIHGPREIQLKTKIDTIYLRIH